MFVEVDGVFIEGPKQEPVLWSQHHFQDNPRLFVRGACGTNGILKLLEAKNVAIEGTEQAQVLQNTWEDIAYFVRDGGILLKSGKVLDRGFRRFRLDDFEVDFREMLQQERIAKMRLGDTRVNFRTGYLGEGLSGVNKLVIVHPEIRRRLGYTIHDDGGVISFKVVGVERYKVDYFVEFLESMVKSCFEEKGLRMDVSPKTIVQQGLIDNSDVWGRGLIGIVF
jgi:hypothetical protein